LDACLKHYYGPSGQGENGRLDGALFSQNDSRYSFIDFDIYTFEYIFYFFFLLKNKNEQEIHRQDKRVPIFLQVVYRSQREFRIADDSASKLVSLENP
jgi:hypothetical protein